MQDISLHLLDIIENSARAKAKNIYLDVIIDEESDKIEFLVKDDGTGMDAETLKNAQNPFYTSKAERVKKVGLGIPLFAQNAELCEGSFQLESELGKGTNLIATFKHSHIDRMPIGNLKDTLISAIIGHAEVDFWVQLTHSGAGKSLEWSFNTAEIKAELGDIPLTYPDVIQYIDENINDGIKKTEMEEN
ncbi:MAG: ATP-binding protein [Candidatus Zophobacter franzmannii]|nr:ATP-binding protein [Candidatus Zophobacter franzmannii]